MMWYVLAIGVCVALALAVAFFSTGLHRAGSTRIERAQLAGESVHPFSLSASSGVAVPLSSFAGQVVLLVNTASKCGYTKQYAGLQQLHRRYAAAGLRVLAVPSNDFLGQEPGSADDIASFCTLNYGVDFPVLAKQRVLGRDAHPLFRWLQDHSPTPGTIEWNFCKFLIDRDGHVLARFGPRIEPEHAEILAAIDRALSAPASVSAPPTGSDTAPRP